VEEALKEKGFDIDKKKISFENVKTTGTYYVDIKLYQGVTSKSEGRCCGRVI
jgi:LSU ribosomal protein L9P